MCSPPVLETAGVKPSVSRAGFFCGHEGDYIPGPCPSYWKTQVSLLFSPVSAHRLLSCMLAAVRTCLLIFNFSYFCRTSGVAVGNLHACWESPEF